MKNSMRYLLCIAGLVTGGILRAADIEPPIPVRTVAPDEALMSTAQGRESGYVAVHMYRGMPWRPYFEAVEQIMLELGGRPHWGKLWA